MIPKNVQMPNPNPKYKPPGTPAGGRGGTLMEIEKLKDMLRNAAGGPVGIQMCQEAADALEQLQAENEKLKAQVPEWIPVEERLPEKENAQVLMTDGEGWYISSRNNMVRFLGCEGIFIPGKAGAGVKVTHWMPLPAAPKEETYEK